MQETRVWSLGWEDPLEEGMATHSSILAWRIPWTEESVRLWPMVLQRAGHTWSTCCKELTHLKRPWCWERWKAGGEGDGRGWDGWMASPTPWTWAWVSSGSWWWTGRAWCAAVHGVAKSRTTTEWLNWTEATEHMKTINHNGKNMKKNICVWLNHFAVQQKLAQHCKSTILQLKIVF